jgi:40S ribosome biogenesis protein Tsr1 and BMS1 C-terminal
MTSSYSSGQFVTMEIEFSSQASESAIRKITESGYLAIFSLLKHENKLSVMHCNVQRNDLTGDTSIIKSKEELYFQVRML